MRVPKIMDVIEEITQLGDKKMAKNILPIS